MDAVVGVRFGPERCGMGAWSSLLDMSESRSQESGKLVCCFWVACIWDSRS
jgi:hypothetical protein